jgi:WD40 repeat protein
VYDVTTRRRILAVEVGSTAPPGLLRLSPGGESIFVGGAKGEIWRIALKSASIEWMSRALSARVVGMGFSRDGMLIAVGDQEGNAAVLDAKTGTVKAARSLGKRRVVGGSFSADGEAIVFGCGGVIEVCRAEDLSTKSRQVGKDVVEDVRSVDFSPRGDELLVCRVMRPHVLSFPELRERRVMQGHTQRVFKAQFSPSGRLVGTVSFDGTARVWDFASGRLLRTFRHDSWVSSLQFTRDESRVMTASDDRTVKIWSVANGEEILPLRGPDSTMHFAAFSEDESTVVTGALNGVVTVYFTRP